MRLNKFLAHCGIASRRKCDELIFSGKIKVNETVITTPGYQVDILKDIVKFNDEILSFEKKIYIALNKPANTLCTLKDDFGRKKIIDLIEGINKRIYPVGRLDYDVEGIILLTNDGELTNKLIHPKFNIEKTYIAEVKGFFNNEKRLLLEKGVIIDNKKTLPAKCIIIKANSDKSTVKLTIFEGRKRQVKKMFETVGNKVLKLKRIKFGPIKLQGLSPGEWRFLTKSEIAQLFKIKQQP